MISARAWIWICLVTVLILGSQASHAARRGLEFPIGDVETVMAKRGAVTEGFLVTAWLPKAIFAPGEQVELWLTLDNVSDQLLRFQRTVPEADFPLVVQDAAGRTLLPRREAVTVSQLAIEIEPGDALVRNYRLKRMYDLSAVGTYHITATATVRRREGRGGTDVVAPTVTLTVTEAAARPPIADRDLGAILFREQRLSVAQVMSLMALSEVPSGGFRLTAELITPRMWPSPVEQPVIKVALHNLSDAALSCWETSQEFNTDVDYIVEGPQGAVLPKHRSPHRLMDGRVVTIPPGEALTRKFRAAYDFSTPGEYRITAVRRMPTPQGWAYLVSNTVVLTVAPKP